MSLPGLPPGISRARVDAIAEDAAQTLATPVFNVLHYGAIGDGSIDDTPALQACADAAEAALGTFHIPASLTCKITSQLDLRYIRSIDIQGRIKVAHTTGIGILIGNASTVVRDVRFFINEVSYAGSQSNVAIRAVGLKNGKITVNLCPYLQLYADDTDTTMTSIAYTDWQLGKVDKLELLGATATSWINENRFHGGRVTTLLVGDGSNDYGHNNNHFLDNNFESPTITFHAGTSNVIRARLEGTGTITLASGTHSNEITQTYYSNQTQTALAGSITVIDNGFDNRVATSKQARAVYAPVFRIDAGSRTINTASEWAVIHASARIRPGFRKLSLPTLSADYLDTGIFPLAMSTPAATAEGGEAITQMQFVSDVSIWRPVVQVYDANRALLDGASTPYINLVGGWVWNAGLNGYTFGTNKGTTPSRIIFDHPNVKYARFFLRGNSITTPFTYAELTAFVQLPNGLRIVDLIQRQMRRPLYQTGTTPPTQSLLHKGDSIGTDTGRLLVTHRVDTTLSVVAASSATSITVTSATGISSGDMIAVLLDDGTTHFTTVNGAPSGNVVTLSVALPSAAAIGNDVATQRFLHVT